MPQSTNHIVMIRPSHFTPNPQTQADNKFQIQYGLDDASKKQYRQNAYQEVTNAANQLQEHGIDVALFDDDGHWDTPDSVFPNNWFSTHIDDHGRHILALYPMYAPNRRRERRADIIQAIIQKFNITQTIDYSHFEQDDKFLEGTGAMVLDRVHRIAYIALSKRANMDVITQFAADFGYTPITFIANDAQNQPIYHTNVMMGIGSGYAIICAQSITDAAERNQVLRSLQSHNIQPILIDQDQVQHFAGNVLELNTNANKILTMSQKSLDILRPDQIRDIENYATILPFSIPTIEMAGGSIRCMIAEIFTR